MPQFNLFAETRRLLDSCKLSRKEISTESGVGFEWLNKFAQDQIPNPGVIHVQKLYDFLVSRTVETSAS